MIKISICIPSYNRVEQLKRLLNSIDSKRENEIEIIIREDNSPIRSSIKEVVLDFKSLSKYSVKYIENESNFGYDKNLRLTALEASGKWIIFMGDDDVFIKDSLDKFIDFLYENDSIGYVLRRYRSNHKSGIVEEHRYYNSNRFFEAGERSVTELFRRSVFISGFTFKKEYFIDYLNNKFDGTLLFQLYIQSTICYKYPSAYCDIPLTELFEGGVPLFGSSNNEKKLYQSGSITFNNSINFLNQVRFLSESIDEILNINVSKVIIKSYSRYSFGYLQEHRDKGIIVFTKYASAIKNIGLGNSIYFYIYYLMLLFLGKRTSKKLIVFIKKINGKTPSL